VGILPLWTITLMVGALFSFIAYNLTKRTPVSTYAKFLTIFGFFQAIVYIIAISNELVSLLETFGIIFGIKSSILGLTVFAFGNSIGEFVTNYSLAKLGSRTMAITACYGGPMLSTYLLT
jgi:sodium/potassium/calcium exchanger 6